MVVGLAGIISKKATIERLDMEKRRDDSTYTKPICVSAWNIVNWNLRGSSVYDLMLLERLGITQFGSLLFQI